jgi:outer membrane beta-barrel protein
MKRHLLFVRAVAAIIPLVAVFAPAAAFAQDATDEIEKMLNQEESVPAAPSTPPRNADKRGQPEIKEVSDLANLQPLSDIAVIQKRFLPKTGRFEFYGALSTIMNDAFFMNFGLNARISYYFRERYGIELIGSYLTTTQRQVTSDLEKRLVKTTSLVTPTSYVGADFKWTPIYGKMTWRNKTITPFDLYFSVGGGTTGTNQGTSEPTLHFGTGQVFAITKAMAFRWDFSWNTFSSKSSVSGSSSASVYNNLFLNLGMSFFFPEATYR